MINFKVVWHLTKQNVNLKKNALFTYLFSIISLFSFEGLKIFVNLDKAGIFLIGFMVLIMNSVSLGMSGLMPPVGFTQKNNNSFSANYLLSINRFLKEYFVLNVFEIIVNSFLMSLLLLVTIYVSYGLESKETTLINVVEYSIYTSLIFSFFIKIVVLEIGFRSFRVRREQLDKSKNVIPYIFLIIAIALSVIIIKYDLIPAGSIFYFSYGFCIGLLILALSSYVRYSVGDLNRKESKIFFKAIMVVFMVAISGSMVVYFVKEINSGNILFSYIKSNNLKKLKKVISENNEFLKLKDSEDGLTPLLYATKKSRLEIAKYILSQKADVNEVNKNGWTPLFYAASNCDLKMSEFLIKKGANINAISSEKSSPLFIAAARKCYPLILYFKQLGANENQIDKNKKNYIQYASDNDAKNWFEFLIRNKLPH